MQLSLYASAHFQTCGILTVTTSEYARVSDFSPHANFAVKWHRICDLTFAVIDKNSSGFKLCRHKNQNGRQKVFNKGAWLSKFHKNSNDL